jgi:hypothetical protein
MRKRLLNKQPLFSSHGIVGENYKWLQGVIYKINLLNELFKLKIMEADVKIYLTIE